MFHTRRIQKTYTGSIETIYAQPICTTKSVESTIESVQYQYNQNSRVD